MDARAISHRHSGEAVGEKRQSRGRRVRLVEHRRHGGARSPCDGMQLEPADRSATAWRATSHPPLGITPETARVTITTNEDRRRRRGRLPGRRSLVARVVTGSVDAGGENPARHLRGRIRGPCGRSHRPDEQLRARAEQREPDNRNPAAAVQSSHTTANGIRIQQAACRGERAREDGSGGREGLPRRLLPQEPAGVLPSWAAGAHLRWGDLASG
jgi:hypothetical protein